MPELTRSLADSIAVADIGPPPVADHVCGDRLSDRALCELFLDLTDGVNQLTVYGPRDTNQRTGVFSMNIEGMSPGELAASLEKDFGICSRPGVHCAPLAHKTIGTHPTGTCRLSFGPFTTEDHVCRAADALARIADGVVARR